MRPPRTTRTSGTAPTGSAQDERGVLAVPALQLVLQRVQHPDNVAASRGHLALLGGEQVDGAREVRVVQRAGVGDARIRDQPLDAAACDEQLLLGKTDLDGLPPCR